MAGVVHKYPHDEPETVPAVRNQQVEEVCMCVLAGIAMEAVYGYPHVIRIVAVEIFRSDIKPDVSYRWLTAACAATSLTFECIRVKEALSMLYYISLGIIRGD